jgi:hypothetical protein
MKKLSAVLAGALVLSFGTAYATPTDSGSGSKSSKNVATGEGKVTNAFFQTAHHQKEFHGDPKSLETVHTRFEVSMHMKGEKAEKAENDESGSSKKGFNGEGRVSTGFAGAMNRMRAADARADAEHASKSKNNDAVANKAADEMGDLTSSGGTGDKHQDKAKQAAKNVHIANDFASAKHQNAAAEKSSQFKQDNKMHMNANQQQQLTKGDNKAESTMGLSTVSTTIKPNGPELGAHNNFFEAKQRSQASSPIERLGKMATPTKFYH